MSAKHCAKLLGELLRSRNSYKLSHALATIVQHGETGLKRRYINTLVMHIPYCKPPIPYVEPVSWQHIDPKTMLSVTFGSQGMTIGNLTYGCLYTNHCMMLYVHHGLYTMALP